MSEHTNEHERRDLVDLAREEDGVAYVEYLTLLTLVTLIGAAAVAALGLPLLRMFRYAEMVILLPVP